MARAHDAYRPSLRYKRGSKNQGLNTSISVSTGNHNELVNKIQTYQMFLFQSMPEYRIAQHVNISLNPTLINMLINTNCILLVT